MAYSLNPISLEKAVSYCPALVSKPAASTSDRYEHIPTIDILTALQKEGFNVHGITATRSRTIEKKAVTKHMVRLRRASDAGRQEAPEVLLINSHDGLCSYQMRAGMIRFICSNGLIAGDFFSSTKVKHMGAAAIPKVIEGTYEVVQNFPKLIEQAETMKALTLNTDEQRILATAALQLRYPEEDKAVQVNPSRILRPQRYEDQKKDLWTTFNTVQEHLIRGGARGFKKDENGIPRAASIRAVNSIDGDVSLNKALWTLATEMAKLKAA